jgi:hypothetical protein
MDGQGYQQARQPDFGRTRTSLNDFVDEIQSVVNVPAIQNANNILDALNRINGRLDVMDGRLNVMDGRLGAIETRLDGMDARLNGIDTRLDGIDTRLDAMDTRTTATDHNHSAIIQNGRLHSGDQPLTALRDPVTYGPDK